MLLCPRLAPSSRLMSSPSMSFPSLNQEQQGPAAGESCCAEVSSDDLVPANSVADSLDRQAPDAAETPALFTLDLSSPAQEQENDSDQARSNPSML